MHGSGPGYCELYAAIIGRPDCGCFRSGRHECAVDSLKPPEHCGLGVDVAVHWLYGSGSIATMWGWVRVPALQ